ncbi:MAG: prepilin-type N-terminal cleavage/methylation domain-containing protein [Pirellulales bacterium]
MLPRFGQLGRRLIVRRPALQAARRPAFTLVEMLVTITVTLVVMLALVNVFEWIGERVASGRAMIEVSGNLRNGGLRLQNDLDSLTVPVRPFPRPEQGDGYFEYIEGLLSDRNSGASSIQGDTDDILSFTARNSVEQFVGRYQVPGSSPVRVVSPEAEIVWWSQFTDLNDNGTFDPDELMSRSLLRRTLVVRPDLNNAASGYWFTLPQTFAPAMTSYNISNQSDLQVLSQHMRMLYNEFDVSVRIVRQLAGNSLTLQIVANSLADLTRRENRWLRHPMVFQVGNSYTFAPPPSLPYALDQFPTSVTRLELIPLNNLRRGEDVILSNVLGFDVRAYDPTVLVWGTGGLGLHPTELGWIPLQAASGPVGRGGFVDLYYSRLFPAVGSGSPNEWTPTAASTFSDAPAIKSRLAAIGASPSYDTWSFHYEQNGIDDDQPYGDTYGVDQGINGIDDDGAAGTDDPGERETSPPYPVPLRGLQTVIRLYEPETRQVRQTSITTEFVPE